NPRAVSLWRALLDSVPNEAREYLSDSDWIEASKIIAVDERDRFLTTRCVLRTILARHLSCEPESIEFAQDFTGALCVAKPHTTLRFHLSYAQNLLLVAVTHARQVGLDVEFMRADLPFEILADHYFEPSDA